jgi:Flp pilus assembly secretin CpaC
MKLIGCATVIVTVIPTLSRCESGPQPIDARPDVTPARVAGVPNPSRTPDAALLKQKLAERDRLQGEIDALRMATGTAELVLVSVQMWEVNLTKLRELDIDVALPDGRVECAEKWLSREHSLSGFQGHEDSINGFVAALAKRNIAKVLTEPKIATVSGRPASFHVGGEVPIPNSDGKGGISYRNFGTEVNLLAETLGENRVRLHVAPRVTSIDDNHSIQVDDQRIPALKVRQCSFTTEVEIGQSAVVSGLVQERVETIETQTGQTSEAVEVALLVVVTPEIVK